MKFIGEEIQQSYLESFHEFGQNMFDRYITYADHWVQDTEHRDPDTGAQINETLNGLVGLWYTPWEWISAALRFEQAQTTTSSREYDTWSLVGGLEFFPVPYLEIRPEYRLVQTQEYRFGQATVQFHAFY